MFELRYLPDVVTLEMDRSRCTGCGMCLEVCPHEVLVRRNGQVEIANRDACMECGACAQNCPTEAITVDAGVGCAAAVLNGWRRSTEPSCDCSDRRCC